MKFHFIDNWDGNIRRFPTLKEARKEAKKQTGYSVAICKDGQVLEHAPASGYTPA